MVPNNTTLQDWLKAHDALLEAERRLSDAAMDYASGRISQGELDAARESVVMLRDLCDAVFRKAVQNLGNLP
jgi:hypothetical protein